MKKVISGFLAFMLLLSCMAAFVVGVGAEETTATTLVAPNFYGIQLTAIDTTKNTQDIRFVSVLTSLDGEMLGYKITADYLESGKNWTKVVTYEKESNTVYRSLLAQTAFGDTEAVTATALGEKMKVDAKAIFAVVMTDVPTNIGEITFTVEAYVKSGETTVTSEKSYFILNNGVMNDKQVLFREDCNGNPKFANMKSASDFLPVTSDAQYGGGYLTSNGWKLYEIVPNEVLKKSTRYTLEFDATTESYIQVCMNFSVDKDAIVKSGGTPMVGNSYHTRVDIRNSFVQVVEWMFKTESTADKDRTDTVRANRVTIDGKQKHHYTIEVDNSGETAVFKVYIDGALTLTANNVKKGVSNGIYFQLSNGDNFDNIKVTTNVASK